MEMKTELCEWYFIFQLLGQYLEVFTNFTFLYFDT